MFLEKDFDKAVDLARRPQTRVLDLTTALLGSLGGTVDPTILSVISNGGSSSSTDLFKNVLLAQMGKLKKINIESIKNVLIQILGLDPATTYLFLNGGFKDSSDKSAMINYLANMGFFPPDMIPFMLGVDDGFNFYINSLLAGVRKHNFTLNSSLKRCV